MFGNKGHRQMAIWDALLFTTFKKQSKPNQNKTTSKQNKQSPPTSLSLTSHTA